MPAGTADAAVEQFLRYLAVERVASAQVSALLSDYEAHPVVVMEALTAGTPCVVSRTSGLTELADAGLVVGIDQDATPEETAAAIARQLDDPIVPDPATLPTWETCVAAVADTYDSVMKDRQVRR